MSGKKKYNISWGIPAMNMEETVEAYDSDHAESLAREALMNFVDENCEYCADMEDEEEDGE